MNHLRDPNQPWESRLVKTRCGRDMVDLDLGDLIVHQAFEDDERLCQECKVIADTLQRLQ